MEPNPAAPQAPKRRTWLIAVVWLLAVAVACVVTWIVLTQPRVTPEAPPPVDAGVAEAPDAGPALSLDEGDALLKRLASGWSADELFKRWLDAASLRHLVAATQAVADGESPRPSLPFVAVAGPFAVREEVAMRPKGKGAKKGKAPAAPPRTFIAPAAYARYDAPTKALTSVDAAAAGAAYARLRPYLDVAFAEVGRPGTRFDDVLAAAIRRVVAVKLPDGEVELVPKGAVWAFKDEALEALKPAEKHVLRLGPANGRALQRWLTDFAQAAKLEVGK